MTYIFLIMPCLLTHLSRGLALMTLLAGTSLAAIGGEADATDSFQRCDQLGELAIPASKIRLATGGALVTASRLVPAGGDNKLGEYCLVDGEVAAASATAQPIKFQLALPSHWNQRVLQLGGGGFRGEVISPVAERGGIQSTQPTVARGYATVGNDSGHSGNPLDASFALDAEQLANFAGEQINKTFDAVSVIVNHYYGQPAEYSYFMGGSSGGREAVTAMRDYADDYQGVISIFPGIGFTRLMLKAHLVYRAMTRDDGVGRIDGAKAGLLRQQILAECDGGDDLVDGILSNPESCQFDFQTLRCPNGQDSRVNCFSDAQLETLQLMHSPVQLNYRFPDGLDSLPGYTIGTDWTSPLLNLGVADGHMGPMANFPPLGLLGLMPAGLIKFLVARDPQYDVSGFDPLAPGALKPRLLEVAGMLDRVNADIGGYIKQGGKLILLHGRSDEMPPEQDTVHFYHNLVTRYGKQVVSDAVAFYLIPGFAHGHGAGFNASGGIPLLSTLDDWVQKGVAPGTLIAVDANKKTAGRSRPLCQYPAWPKYDGTGDPNIASSFLCVKP